MTRWELLAARRATEVAAPAQPGDQLQAVVSHGSVGFLETTQDGTITKVNAAASRMFGYRAEELIGTSVHALTHPDHRHQDSASVLVAGPGPAEVAEVMHLYRHRSGHKIYARCSVSTSRAHEGAPPATVMLLQDLTSCIVSHTSRVVAERAGRLAPSFPPPILVGAEPTAAGAVALTDLEQEQEQERRLVMEGIIQGALEADRVGVCYQPVFDLTTGRVVGAEALLRIRDKQGRVIPPLAVIPVAEATGQIAEIGRRVLRLAAEQSARWQAERGVALTVSVNVSALQLTSPDFLGDVDAALTAAGASPSALSVELTESVLLEAGSLGVERLRALRDAGILVAIDDFGTGYASLSYLLELPAATLKIDRSFVQGIPHDRAAVAIVDAVIGLAASFDMVCVAEGIETEAQQSYLAERRVLGQGFLLGRPDTGAALELLLSEARTGAQPLERPSSIAEARDDAGNERDVAGDERDVAGGERDVAGGERDVAGDERDVAGDERDVAGDERDVAGDERDLAADRRDAESGRRDLAAERRDEIVAQYLETGLREIGGTVVDLLASVRRDAAEDRESASRDRRAGAAERSRAGADRGIASTDRGVGASERVQAAHERQVAFTDRESGAEERAHAGGDRNIAHADRHASALERDASSLDDLTGVLSRGPGARALDREIERAARDGETLVCAFVDVDGLKAINDERGHAAGDEVLRHVAASLRGSLRPTDVVARYGGDEFLLVMVGLPRGEVERRLDAVDRALARHPAAPTVTVGLSQMSPEDSAQSLIDRADAAIRGRRADGRVPYRGEPARPTG